MDENNYGNLRDIINPAALISLKTDLENETAARIVNDVGLRGQIGDIEEKIPPAASNENQLADKAFALAINNRLTDAVTGLSYRLIVSDGAVLLKEEVI
jgi:hypothetical protein